MKALCKITLEDYLNIIEIARKNNKNIGESMEVEFIAYMKEKGQKPVGHTGLNKKELIEDMLSHDNNILNIETDNTGKQKYEIFKKKPDLDK